IVVVANIIGDGMAGSRDFYASVGIEINDVAIYQRGRTENIDHHPTATSAGGATLVDAVVAENISHTRVVGVKSSRIVYELTNKRNIIVLNDVVCCQLASTNCDARSAHVGNGVFLDGIGIGRCSPSKGDAI